MQPSNFILSMVNNWKPIRLMWWLKCNGSWKLHQSWTIPIICDLIRKRDSFVKLLKVIAPNVWVNRKGNRIRQWMIGAWKCYKGKWRKVFWLENVFEWFRMLSVYFRCCFGCFYVRVRLSSWITLWWSTQTLQLFPLWIESYNELLEKLYPVLCLWLLFDLKIQIQQLNKIICVWWMIN